MAFSPYETSRSVLYTKGLMNLIMNNTALNLKIWIHINVTNILSLVLNSDCCQIKKSNLSKLVYIFAQNINDGFLLFTGLSCSEVSYKTVFQC